MELSKFVLGVYEENSYLISDESTAEAIIIDPGENPAPILEMVKSQNLKVKYILNTHAHIDHVLGVEEVKRSTGAPFYLNNEDLQLLEGIPSQAKMIGLDGEFPVPEVDGDLLEGDVFEVGSVSLKVLSTPGHSPGSVTFVTDGAAFVGDALFAGSVGRVDLPGGSWKILQASLLGKICKLDRDTKVYSGHGPDTTIGEEIDSNPFLREGMIL